MRENNEILKYISNKLPIEKNYVYYFQIEISNSKNKYYLTDQVHFFVIVNDDNPTLIQTFGGVKKITVKNINIDVNEILNELLNLNHNVFKNLFDVPDDLDEILYFDEIEMIYVKQELKYPTLKRLDELIAPLSFNKFLFFKY